MQSSMARIIVKRRSFGGEDWVYDTLSKMENVTHK